MIPGGGRNAVKISLGMKCSFIIINMSIRPIEYLRAEFFQKIRISVSCLSFFLRKELLASRMSNIIDHDHQSRGGVPVRSSTWACGATSATSATNGGRCVRWPSRCAREWPSAPIASRRSDARNGPSSTKPRLLPGHKKKTKNKRARQRRKVLPKFSFFFVLFSGPRKNAHAHSLKRLRKKTT